MEKKKLIGEQIKIARQQMKLSQVELASMSNLNIRTVQRIENNEVSPRLYTLRIIGKVLDIELMTKADIDSESEQLKNYRRLFYLRKRKRLNLFYGAIVLLAVTLLLILSGIPKYFWAPFVYLLFFIDFLIIGLTWRCPGCNSLLGDVFNVHYCSKCGLQFYDE